MNKTNSSQEFWQDILQLNPAKNTALYIQLADRIRFFIQEKKLNPGDKLPVSREIQRISGLSSITVENGISILVKEGWLTRRPHYGTFVVDKGSVEASAGKNSPCPGCVQPDLSIWRVLVSAPARIGDGSPQK